MILGRSPLGTLPLGLAGFPATSPPAPPATIDAGLYLLLRGGAASSPASPKVPIYLLCQGIAMPAKGAALTLSYTAWDTVAGRPKLGDTGQHTLYWNKDGVTSTTTNSPVAVTSPADVGESTVLLTASECTANFGKLTGVSSTAGVILIPVPVAFESGRLGADGLDAIQLETGINARQGMTVMLAESAGVITGVATGSYVFTGAGVSTTRITAAVNTNGERVNVVLSLPS